MIIVTRNSGSAKIYINRKYIVSFWEVNWTTNETKFTATKIIMASATENESIHLVKETPEQLLTLLQWDSYGIKEELL